jgi:CheY-like chemotaxis protein
MDGGRLGKAIKSDQTLCETVLVLLTPAGQRGDASRSADAGFAAYLSGPLRDSEFREVIERVWSAHQRGEKLGLVTRHTIAEARQNKVTAARASNRFIHANILVAEDNPVNQQVAIEILKTLGCNVDIAEDGRKAIEMHERGTYDMIFMDCRMPNMDGYEATQEIRCRETQGQHVPIIAMTAHALKGDRERCLAAGMDDYVAKPVSPDIVMNAVVRWFKGEPEPVKTGPAVIETPAIPESASQETTEAEAPLLDRAKAMDVTGGNTRILGRVTQVYLASMPEEVAKLADAIKNGRKEEAHRLAHSIKSASASLGGMRVSQLAFKMEMAAKESNIEKAREILQPFETEFARFRTVLQEINWDQTPGNGS